MYKILLAALLSLCASSNMANAIGESFSLNQEAEKQIFVNNRILAKVNGKAISVIDVMKKMDMLFYKQYPQYTNSAMARFQFYQMSWKHILQELIDKELIITDASENKLPLTTGDIRQELESLFGPNIIINLDKVGLTFDEAWKMVQDDIMLKRMIYIRVHAKAMKKVTPKDVREAYEEFSRNNLREDEWQYQVISIRNADPVKGAETAQFAYQLLAEQKVPIADLPKHITTFAHWSDTTRLNISEEFKHNEKDLAANYKEILNQLQPNCFSQPVAQKSRKDSSTVCRIFYLKEKVPGGIVPFSEVENKLREKLVNDVIDQETDAYIKKLRRHFNVQESDIKDVTGNFEPFVLK